MTCETGFQAGFVVTAVEVTLYMACRGQGAAVRDFSAQVQGESQPSSSSITRERQMAARGNRPSEGDGGRRWATWAGARLASRKCPSKLPQ